MVLKLSTAQLAAIRSHAESTYPEECCGLFLGYIKGSEKMVVEVWPSENVYNSQTTVEFFSSPSLTKRHRYVIEPKILLKAQKEARERQQAVIGFYHSHIDSSAVPSECDREYAWPIYSYLIISVHQGQTVAERSWCLDDNRQFQPEEILYLSPATIKLDNL
ncbi:MAG: M67 family metallopeptidase [Oscillatoriaceae bacterium SKW80]|nr:M67 family metallopeptidase [Oscillatoriaceae bacterium SKYG93]MCX8120151.1 M67 family metallopeptidase [Oscillatoriaceae bacterium SKW80]MDW8453077.1 M67 family metallopeptidase [Oscillatoriaceae cyanobacterium SKYGB_i_bin93]HIK29012.1 M67 family metallopeptidase [Oscillatoriaceae cyanobacterium M7585_C2015_266]